MAARRVYPLASRLSVIKRQPGNEPSGEVGQILEMWSAIGVLQAAQPGVGEV